MDSLDTVVGQEIKQAFVEPTFDQIFSMTFKFVFALLLVNLVLAGVGLVCFFLFAMLAGVG